ncbi:hypothetical protein [Pseudomonas oryzihabitans]|uniref:hypothetical protein n=1 Tax=Pseudomonas oryzihabitans TaxID=47885 RepID=UPI001DCF2228|nr:hypothetical protein [Pseudomonas oryzihabitans]HJE71677.1 hypothetical protein [Pseudomonas oryzihabitans]
MTNPRKFKEAGIVPARLIVNVHPDTVAAIDKLIKWRHPAQRNRAEFVRLALEEKIQRDQERGYGPAL